MKVLTIVGSGRKQGNTSRIATFLLNRITSLAKLDGELVETEKLFLSDYNLEHCIGCRNCMDRGEEKCPLKDDLPIIKSNIDEADAVIFGSPVYVDNVSSLMKALIDRLAYICHRQEFFRKSAFVYSTSGGSRNKKTNNTMVGAMISWGFNFLGTASFIINHHDTKEEKKEQYDKSLDKTARKVYRSVRDKSFQNPSIITLAIFKLQQRERADPNKSHPLDYKYWKENGWTDNKIDFYIKHNSSPLKIFLSKVVYKIIYNLYVQLA